VLTTRHELGLLLRARPAMAGLLVAGRVMARARRPLVRVPQIGWVTADPEVGRQILGDHRSFTILGEGGVGHLWAQILGDWVLDLFDGPGHHDVRSRSRELFTEAGSAALVEQAWHGPLDSARAELRAGGEVDVALLSRVLVGRMMISLLGIPAPEGHPDPATWPSDEDAARAFATGERLASIALGSAGSTYLTPEQVATGREIVAELTRGVPEGWRTAPAHQLLGRCRELGLGLEETTGLASLLMVAGTETSASAIARTTALLIDTGEQHRLLASLAAGSDTSHGPGGDPARGPESDVGRAPGTGADTDAMTGAVREGLRMTSPASVIGRGVAADVEIAGRRLTAGERVMILTWSANSHVGPYRVNRPYVRETRQLWFGAGRHLCLGAALARAEIAAVLHTLWDDGVPLRITGRRAQRRVLIPNYSRLVVTRAPADR